MNLATSIWGKELSALDGIGASARLLFAGYLGDHFGDEVAFLALATGAGDSACVGMAGDA